VVVLGGDRPETPALLEHAAQSGQVLIGRGHRVALGQLGPDGGGVRVAERGPVQGQGVALAAAEQAGDGV